MSSVFRPPGEIAIPDCSRRPEGRRRPGWQDGAPAVHACMQASWRAVVNAVQWGYLAERQGNLAGSPVARLAALAAPVLCRAPAGARGTTEQRSRRLAGGKWAWHGAVDSTTTAILKGRRPCIAHTPLHSQHPALCIVSRARQPVPHRRGEAGQQASNKHLPFRVISTS